EFRGEYREARVNPRNIAEQKRIITLPPSRDRPEKNFEKTRNVAGARASQSAHSAVARGRGIAFVLVDLRDRHRDFRRSEKEIGQAAAKLARRAVVVRGRVLNVGKTTSRKTDEKPSDNELFHKVRQTIKQIL